MSGGSGKTYLILVLFLLFFSNNGRSENDFQTVDRLTLAYFNEGKWDSVITIGKSALKDHIDYYYLRLRMGISYFHLEKYYPATEHLNKAIAFNSSDPLAYTYLYQAYLRTGRTQEAKRVQRFVPDQKPDSSVLKKYLEWIYAEGGPMLSSDDGRMPGGDLYGNDSIYGEEDLYGNSYYGFMGLKVHASPVVSFNLNYTYFDFKKIKNLQYGYFEEHLDSTGQFWWGHQNYYSFHKITGQEHFEYHVHQHEFHLGSEILLKNQLSINPAVHLVYDKYSQPNTRVQTYTVNDTAWVDTSAHTFPFTRTKYSFPVTDTAFYNFVVSLQVSKTISRVKISINGSWSNLNNMIQKQAGASATWYPLGDSRLYETTSLTGFFQEKGTRLIIQQTVGGNAWKKLWLEGMFSWGDLTNVNTVNGAVVYNNTGRIRYILAGSASWIFNENWSFFLHYRYGEKESPQTVYEMNQPGESSPFIINQKYHKYTTQTLSAGIQWKF